MSEQDVEQEAAISLEAEPDINQQAQNGLSARELRAKHNAALAAIAAREANRRAQREAEKARVKYEKKYGWTEAQFVEYWKLRYIPKAPGEKETAWNRLLDNERKRVDPKKKPRKNRDRKAMTPEDRLELRRKEGREAVARHRAGKAAAAALEAAANGERELTEVELALISAAEAEQSETTSLTAISTEIEDLLASLREAEDAERATEDGK